MIGEVLSENANAEPIHKWSGWEVTTEPTYEDDGEETRTCAYCRQTETRVVPHLYHVGDVSGDGEVTIADVTALLNCLRGGAEGVERADINGDGIVNVCDITDLLDLVA